jgi:hypothetical protein
VAVAAVIAVVVVYERGVDQTPPVQGPGTASRPRVAKRGGHRRRRRQGGERRAWRLDIEIVRSGWTAMAGDSVGNVAANVQSTGGARYFGAWLATQSVASRQSEPREVSGISV